MEEAHCLKSMVLRVYIDKICHNVSHYVLTATEDSSAFRGPQTW